MTVLDIQEIKIEGEKITSIVGPSGAGKSTLLHILGTLLKPTEGQIFYQNTETTSMNDDTLSSFRNQNLGFVFQSHNLLPEFTAIENVSLPAMIKGDRKEEYVERAKDLLNFIGLKDRYYHKPSQLSGGEQQRVSIARALINQPKLVFADEPTGNLDSKNADEINELFEILNAEQNCTFLIITHNDKLAKRCHYQIEMRDGKIVH